MRVIENRTLRRRRRGSWLLVLSLCLPGFAFVAPGTAAASGGEAQASVDSLDALLRGLARMPGLYAEFKEEKRMALLAAPLVNEGSLHFADGKLARHTHVPMRSSLVIKAGRMEFGDESGSDSLDLDANPVIRLFVDSFVKIFAGDRAALDRIYAMKFSERDGQWTWELRPKVEPMNKVIDHVVIEGRGLVLFKMTVLEVGGDETVTTFSKVDVKKRYSAQESAKVFSVRR